MKLSGKTALVTGASTGIGREISKAIAAEGARVYLTARSNDRLEETRSIIESAGGSAHVFRADLRNETELESLASAIDSVDILAHVAGVWHDDHSVYAGVRLVDTPSEQIKEVMEVGILAPMLLTRRLLPGMMARRSGKILGISGTFASGGAGWLHYYVSKLALEHLIVGLSQELREFEIQANCISPSDTDTEALRRFFPDDARTAISPTEVAKLAVFLVSQEADNVTGQCIVVKNKSVH
jgi:NAD(P)-dependent dehydrogenase (short-subunit alcohol dehydrogenase family)